MKKNVYIVDLIGSYCGMHYYDKALLELLKTRGFNAEILSNFSDNSKNKFFLLIFKKTKILGIIFLLINFVRFFSHIMRHQKSIYIYMCYGEFYDLLMMSLGFVSDRIVCDVHEVHALKYADDSIVSKMFNLYYRRAVRCAIIHSERTERILSGFSSSMNIMFVPHFKYVFEKKYDLSKVSLDIQRCFASKNKKFLFFGNLSVVKGVDVVESVFCNLTEDQKSRVELVVAGKNVEAVDFNHLKKASKNYNVFDRHINDDEMVYLYSHTDYVLLPYKKSSQSGIFAMAAYFRKPMLLSNIPYFVSMIDNFKSFGCISSIEDFSLMIKCVIDDSYEKKFFVQDDLSRFEQQMEMEKFIENFNSFYDQKVM